MLSLTRRGRIRRPALVAMLSIAVALPTLLVAGPVAASPQDELAQKQKVAEQLQAKIAANGERISMLDEQYNQAQLSIDAAADGIADTEARFGAATQRSDDLRAELASRAAALYVGAANGGPADVLDAGDVSELSTRSKYGSAAADEDHELIDDLTIAKEQLEASRAEFEAQKREAESHTASLESTRAEIAGAQDEQEALLADAQGDIAQLVAQIEQQRRAAEESQARAAAQKRAEENAAKRAAAPAGGRSTARRPNGSAPTAAAPAPNGGAQTAVNTAMAQLGKPYRYAGVGPGSFDCSGLTMYAWAAAGVRLPHSSAAQYSSLPHVSQDQLAPGDLVFYGHPIHHVGMYIGNGQYVHAPQTGDVVKVASIFRKDWAGAARPA
jgi:cell wall-associated NlpC family hydrolase